MDDLELLVMAAKAAGIQHVDYENVDYDGCAGLVIVGEHGQHLHGWNPLADDGDALRLAISLRLELLFFNGYEEIRVESSKADDVGFSVEKFSDDMGASVRRAIVRAAAEIGIKMP